MTYRIVILFFLLSLSTSTQTAFGQSLPEEVLTLKDAIKMALENHRSIKIADRKILEAKDKIKQAVSIITPKINADAKYEVRNNESGSVTDDRKFITGDKATGTAGISLIVPVYDFGASSSVYETAKTGVKVSEALSVKARQDITFAVSQAYFKILEANKIKSVVEESITTVDRQLKIAKDFYAQGLVAQNDVLTAEIQLAERKQELIKAENNIRLAVSGLNLLIGSKITDNTGIEDITEIKKWEGTFDAAVKTALEKRPDLEALRQNIEIAKREFDITRQSGYYPHIYAFGNYTATTNTFLLNKKWLAGGLAVDIPIFDGGKTRSLLSQNEKQISESIDIYEQKIDDVTLEIQKAYLLLHEYSEKIPVAELNIKQAEENLRIIKDQYAEGLVTSADILAEEDRLSRSRSNYFQTLYNYHTALAQLANAIGVSEL